MKRELSEELIRRLKQIYEQVEIYTGEYSELDTKENGILRAVGRFQRPRISEVARELRISMSTASWCIDRLEKKMLLKRRRSETDRRAVHLVLTKKGKEIVRQFDGLFEKIAGVAEESLSDGEMETLLSLLKRIEVSK